MKEQMINYLQNMLTRYQTIEAKYGADSEYADELFTEMIACKEMVEALICEPVNLGLNGKVTVGF